MDGKEEKKSSSSFQQLEITIILLVFLEMKTELMWL